MKTPRELIIERHHAAEAKLKAIHAEDLAAYARSAAGTNSRRRPAFSLAVFASSLWLEAVWPWRRAWIGVAAGWLVILTLHLATRDTPSTMAARPHRPNPEVMAVLQQQEQLLTQLLGTETPAHVSKPRTPGPRSSGESPRATGHSAGNLKTRLRVAQISNLLYRRIPFRESRAGSQPQQLASAMPIGNRRYGRLEICATS